MDDRIDQLTPNEAINQFLKQALQKEIDSMYDMEDKEGLSLQPKKEISGYFVEYNGGIALIQSDDHSICDGELSIIRDGKTVCGFAQGEWTNYAYLPNEKIYRYYQERHFQEPTPKPDRKWWQFWK